MRLSVLFVAAGLAACAPSDPEGYANAKWALCDDIGYPETRIEACSAVVTYASSPQRRAAALVNRGMVRAELGQHARAVADFGRALRIDRNNADALIERGIIHFNRGDLDNALRDYDAALELDPFHDVARERRRTALQSRDEQLRSQMGALNVALQRDPLNPEFLNNRCWIRAVAGDDLHLALADCDAALRVQPRLAAALDSRGLVHFKLGQYEAAIADYEAALAEEPGRGHYLYGRGLARLRLGMIEEGQADLAAAEVAEPGVSSLYASYGAAPS